MPKIHAFALVPFALVAAPAVAGEEVLYEAATPAWVEEADFEAALLTGEPFVLLDEQVRLEDGVVHKFSDVANRIENPEALSKLGTLKLGWLPDKGDLIVHRLAIVRDDEQIDLIGDGVRYDVLRRERELEKRSLDGQLTATLAVPGLKVGDVLRFSQTITRRDQALNGEVQSTEGLSAEPSKLGFGRVRVSWPEGDSIRWQLTRAGVDAEPVAEDGYLALTVLQPVPEPDEMPKDAPARYTINPLLQVASFDDWRDVSRVMAPHFATEGSVAAGGPISRQVERITARTDDELERAALALRLVQDEISYLLNGLNGGNYLPQSPAETWENRYGDCKAKSLLLLAMLREMGIESEAVLVRSKAGDMVASLLPAPAAFDHMIVRARIDGKDYWLDGTGRGTRLNTIDEVPSFHYALPLREGGAELIPIEQRWPEQPDRETLLTLDYSAGLDLPVVYDVEITARGAMGARLQPQVNETDAEDLRDFAAKYVENIVGEGIVYDASVTYDDESGVAKLSAKGLMGSEWQWDRGRGSRAFSLPSTGFDFAPDRARKAWRNIPVAVSGPVGFVEQVTLVLPEDVDGYDLKGIAEFDDVVAGVRIERAVTRDGNTITIRDDASKIPSEIAVSELSAERAKAARFKGGDPVLTAPRSTLRYWEFPEKGTDKRVAKLEEAYGVIIENDPEEAWRWSMRGSLREYHGDLDGALEDYSKALDLEPTVDRYFERAGLYQEIGRPADAIADAPAAYDLDAQGAHAIYLAQLMAENGDLDDAIALLDPLELSGDERVDLFTAKSEILGEAGRLEEGWGLLEEIALERPGDGVVLNAQCWYMGLWSYRLDEAEAICNEAVQTMEYSASVLDSRALMHYRKGDNTKALRDLNAALASEPGQGASLYLRGVIRSQQGDKGGASDIAAAKRIYRNYEKHYARYDIAP